MEDGDKGGEKFGKLNVSKLAEWVLDRPSSDIERDTFVTVGLAMAVGVVVETVSVATGAPIVSETIVTTVAVVTGDDAVTVLVSATGVLAIVVAMVTDVEVEDVVTVCRCGDLERNADGGL